MWSKTKKLFQNKSLSKSIQIFLVCLVVLGGAGSGKNVEAADNDILVYYTSNFPAHPPKIYSLDLGTLGFTAIIKVRSGAGELTDGTINLSNYGQVWIVDTCNGAGFTAGEITAIENFRNNGGGLLLSVDNNGCQERINPITEKFNNDTEIFFQSPNTTGICFAPSFVWAGHPIKHLLYFGLNNLSSSQSDACFNIQNPDIEITAKNPFDNSALFDVSGLISCDDTYGAVLDECGKGRIVFDSSLVRFITYAGSCTNPEKSQYQQNIAQWLDVYTPCPLPTCDLFTATPATINPSDISNLKWTTTNATSADITNNIGDPAIIGISLPDSNTDVTPASTVTYTLTVTNIAGDTDTCSATVTVCVPRECSYYPGQCGATLDDGCGETIDCSGACGAQICCWDNCQDPVCSNDNDCDDTDVCTTDTCNNAGTCAASCSYSSVGCVPGDGCCLIGCTNPPDTDCASSSGHGNYFKYDKDIKLVFTEGAQFLLRIAGGLALFVIIFGGIYYMTMGSNPDGQNKAKKIVTYAVIGLAIVLVSYIIIAAVESIAV